MFQVILVDDDPLVLEGLKNAVDWDSFSYEISLAATSPLTALEYLRENPVHLLITDISMPEMDGIELIRQAKAINPLLSVLVLSAFDTFSYVRAAMRQGAENYLLKPLNPDELSESLRAVSAHLQERKQLSSLYGTNMLSFRSTFVENWVHQSLSDDEFLSRAELLGINLQPENYTVLIFCVSAEFMPMFLDRFFSLVMGRYLTHFYMETASCLVSIISSVDADCGLDWLYEKLEQIRMTLDYPFFVSIGQTVDYYGDVSTSYRTAKKYLFLQYTDVTNVNCSRFEVPAAAWHMIEQSWLEVDETSYLKNCKKMISSPVSTYKRMGYQLAIVGWGVQQTLVDDKPEPSIIGILSRIVGDAKNIPAMETYIEEFFHTVKHLLLARQEIQNTYYPVVNAVIDAVHDFSNKDISLKTLAQKLNIHPSYLGTVFRQQTGYYFNDYLNDVRLQYAAKLMETTEMKLKDIVNMAGFSSQTYFNRLFKRKYGVSPMAYRTETRISSN